MIEESFHAISRLEDEDEAAKIEEANPLFQLRSRLIQIDTLSSQLKAVLVLTFLVVLAAGFVFFFFPNFGSMPQSRMSPIGPMNVPLLVFLFGELISVLGWVVLFVGAYMTSRIYRTLIVIMFIAILCIAPVTDGFSLLEQTHPMPWFIFLRLGQLVAIGVLLAWLLRLNLGQRLSPDDIRRRSFLLVCCCVAAYFTFDALLTAFNTTGASQDIAGMLSILQVISILASAVIIWSSTDFIEWGEVIAGSIATFFIRRNRFRLFYLLVGIAAMASLIDMLRRINVVGLVPGVVVTGIIIGLSFVLVRLALADRSWTDDIPLPVLLFTAFFLFFITYIVNILAHSIALRLGIQAANENFVLTILAMLASLLVFTGGVGLIRRKNGRNTAESHVSGAFLGIVALLIFALNIPQFLSGLHLPLFAALQPSPASFKIIANVGTISMLTYLLLSRRLTPEFVKPFLLALVLVAGLQCVGWYYQIFLPLLHSTATRSVLISTLVIVLAILWDILFSGSQITNRESEAFPREGRVLLYAGYVLNALVLLLNLSGHSQMETATLGALSAQANYFQVVGAFGLGVPLAVFTFTAHFVQWSQKRLKIDAQS